MFLFLRDSVTDHHNSSTRDCMAAPSSNGWQPEITDPSDSKDTSLELVSLDLRLSYDNSYKGIEAEAKPRVFSCNYCSRKFFSSQAVGGHQNAHRRERKVAKTGHKLVINSTECRSSRVTSLPLQGFSRSLGIQEHSKIHKPSSDSPVFGSFHPLELDVWDMQPLHMQVAAGRWPSLENYLSGASPILPSRSGEAKFDGGMTLSPNRDSWFKPKHHHNELHELHCLDLSLRL